MPPGTGSDALTFASRRNAPADPAAWPQPWRDLFVKLTAAPILWTYHELGADLSGVGRSPERSTFFRELIGELRLPKGSSVFWPCAMPVSGADGEASLCPDPVVFSVGLARLSPQLVVVLGERAMADMGLAGRCGYFRQVMVEGKLLVLLPEIEELLRGAVQRSSAVSLLRAVISSVNLG